MTDIGIGDTHRRTGLSPSRWFGGKRGLSPEELLDPDWLPSEPTTPDTLEIAERYAACRSAGDLRGMAEIYARRFKYEAPEVGRTVSRDRFLREVMRTHRGSEYVRIDVLEVAATADPTVFYVRSRQVRKARRGPERIRTTTWERWVVNDKQDKVRSIEQVALVAFERLA